MSATYPLSLGHYREDFYGYIDIISLGNTFAIKVCASISLYYGYFYENSKNEKKEKKNSLSESTCHWGMSTDYTLEMIIGSLKNAFYQERNNVYLLHRHHVTYIP